MRQAGLRTLYDENTAWGHHNTTAA